MNEINTAERATYSGKSSGTYAGRRVSSRQKSRYGTARRGVAEGRQGRYGRVAVKLVICVAIIGAVLLFKYAFPVQYGYIEGGIRQSISGGVDYRAVFSAFGAAITGEEKITDVFRDIAAGNFNIDALEGAEPIAGKDADILPSPDKAGDEVVPLGGGDAPLDLATLNRLVGDGLDTLRGSYDRTEKRSHELDGSLQKYFIREEDEYEEASLTLTREEGDDTPENVSYEYYPIEFDYTLPVDGTLTSKFGYRIHPISGKRSFHYGLDIGAAAGTDISAFAAGTVEAVGYDSIYGNYLFIRHKDGIITFYGHCKKVLVEEGQLVLLGEQVAQVGSTGYSTGPHLHFEVRNGDINLDPALYVTPGA